MYIVLLDFYVINLYIYCVYFLYCFLDRMFKNIYEIYLNVILCRYDLEFIFFWLSFGEFLGLWV